MEVTTYNEGVITISRHYHKPMLDAHKRLKRIEKTLRAGVVPILRQYTDGVESLLKQYGMQDAVLGPSGAMKFQEVQKARVKWKENRRYKRDKMNIGESVKAREDSQLKAAKARLLKMLKKEI